MVRISRKKRELACFLIPLILLIFLYLNYDAKIPQCVSNNLRIEKSATSTADAKVVFISGFPFSGQSHLQRLLQLNHLLNCEGGFDGISKLLNLATNWKKSPTESKRLKAAGVTQGVVHDALGAFIMGILRTRPNSKNYACHQNPDLLRFAPILLDTLPASKFILLLRDPRALLHQILSNGINIKGFNLTSYEGGLKEWSAALTPMFEMCEHLGRRKCWLVKYEDLVLNPKAELLRISSRLGIPRKKSALATNLTNDEEIGLSLSLTEWVGQLPLPLVEDMHRLVPILDRIGYDPRANPPNYGIAMRIGGRRRRSKHGPDRIN